MWFQGLTVDYAKKIDIWSLQNTKQRNYPMLQIFGYD